MGSAAHIGCSPVVCYCNTMFTEWSNSQSIFVLINYSTNTSIIHQTGIMYAVAAVVAIHVLWADTICYMSFVINRTAREPEMHPVVVVAILQCRAWCLLAASRVYIDDTHSGDRRKKASSAISIRVIQIRENNELTRYCLTFVVLAIPSDGEISWEDRTSVKSKILIYNNSIKKKLPRVSLHLGGECSYHIYVVSKV